MSRPSFVVGSIGRASHPALDATVDTDVLALARGSEAVLFLPGPDEPARVDRLRQLLSWRVAALGPSVRTELASAIR